jgi:hypothetical protein
MGISPYLLRWMVGNVYRYSIIGSVWTGKAGVDFVNADQVRVVLESYSPCANPDTAVASLTMTVTGSDVGINGVGAPDGFKAYPNPGHGVVNFEGLSRGNTISIRDISGRELQAVTVDKSGIYTVDISQYAQGVYLFYFSGTNDKRWQVKVVKE